MKICFSTLGCPDFEWPDVYSMAKDLGFDGIELRSYGLPADPYRSKPFTGAQLAKTVAKLRALKLEIPCISSNCCLNEKDNEEQNRKELEACMELAQAVGAPYIRVLGDRYGEVTGVVDAD
jgi:fatty-acyl-CoA synthase